MKHKTFLFTALLCIFDWCCTSCETKEPELPSDNNSSYVAKGISISKNKQVLFSPGNLQYQASTDTWQFATQQYDILGESNVFYGTTLADKIDLFGWSGSIGAAKWGISSSTSIDDYAGDFVDWGTNKIGHNTENTWRTLSIDEWEYLLFERINAEVLLGIAKVNNIDGVILLPDNFKLPEDSYFFPVNDGAINVYTAKSWKSMEQNGAVFLPEAGFRRVIEPSTFGGYYWSSTADVHLSGCAYSIDFACSDGMKRLANTHLGHAVRLVKDL